MQSYPYFATIHKTEFCNRNDIGDLKPEFYAAGAQTVGLKRGSGRNESAFRFHMRHCGKVPRFSWFKTHVMCDARIAAKGT